MGDQVSMVTSETTKDGDIISQKMDKMTLKNFTVSHIFSLDTLILPALH